MNEHTINELPVPDNEQERLEALDRYNILDTLPEEEYDAITKLASYICQVPIALISLIDENRQWFKSKVGLQVRETSRSISFCQYAIMGEDMLQIQDTHQDARLAANPMVTGDPHIRFYAGAPLVTPDGYALGTLCVIDTKPRNLSGEQMEAMQTLAKSVVAQLVLRDQKKKLKEEKEKALQSVKTKEQFLANMSHEIRTPLNGIMGLTNLLLASQLTEEQLTFLTYIKNSADNLLIIINDILDFSKIESGKLTFESVPFQMHQLFDSVVGLHKSKAEHKGLQLSASVSEDIPDTLLGDPVRLGQILNNLVDNAIKFTESGKVTVSINKESQTGNSVRLLFTIQDTGIGIPKEKYASIFESFTQANNDTTRKYGGTGLGLAISKRLIETQGGKIWVNSQENQGSSFQFLLSFPMAAPQTAHQNLPHAEESTSASIKVLVAEDNEVNQLIISKVLEARDFQVSMASNGQQAIDQLQSNPFDIVLMDIQMPVMDGYEAIQYIRNSSKPFQHIPIIALTAHAIKREIEKCIDAGATDHVSKPFQPDDLISKIEKLAKIYKGQL
jgi:signal transduction histidine kinase/ActR/RegA family two-component response regulator